MVLYETYGNSTIVGGKLAICFDINLFDSSVLRPYYYEIWYLIIGVMVRYAFQDSIS